MPWSPKQRAAMIARTMMLWVGLSLLVSLLAEAFAPTPVSPSIASSALSAPSPAAGSPLGKRTNTRLSCICVDCKWVTSCRAYHFVETKHEQPHMSEEPTFLPREGSPTIQVNIRTEQRQPKPSAGVVDKAPPGGMWKDQLRALEDDENEEEPQRDARYYEETGTVEAVRTNTTVTIEYDVTACADFVQDKGCWVRNMPDEIKRVNPDFVPT